VASRKLPSAETKRATRSGRHPAARRVRVQFTDPAFEDLQVIARKKDPQVVRAALKECLLLERDPEAGEPLKGGLIGYRKLVVGDRDWRIIWRVTHDDTGVIIVDVAEIWAVGARSDADVYDELAQRVKVMGREPHTMPLAEAIDALGKLAYGLGSQPEPDDELPAWLVGVLTSVVGMPAAEVRHLSVTEAQSIWDSYKGRTR
jgi:mRNA interferase RelE/StbE